MVNRLRGVLLISLVVLALSFLPGPTVRGQGLRYFPETGHWITGEFLTKYESVPDPVKLFGYPITDAFLDQTTKYIVQYFQKAHFVLNTQKPPELRVQLTLLGDYMFKEGPVLTIPANFPACRYFIETRHQVCYAFLDFFKENGGIGLFGYPISEIEVLDGRMVQYFQRARFEWHPEFPAGERVTLTDLGRQYFLSRREDSSRLLPNPENFVQQTILTLKVRAFPDRAVTPQEGEQTLYVIVQDQNLQSVTGATVTATVKFPSGDENFLDKYQTDKFGITKIDFDIKEQPQGIAEILVSVSYDNLAASTRTSFRIWW